MADEIGDLLFATVNLARWHKLDAEAVLQRATDKFVRRFRHVEVALKKAGSRWEDATFAQMDALWDQAKKPAADTPV